MKTQKIKLTLIEKEELTKLIKKAKFKPSKEVAAWFRANPKFNFTIEDVNYLLVMRCQKCKEINWPYPHIMHMKKEHNIEFLEEILNRHLTHDEEYENGI